MIVILYGPMSAMTRGAKVNVLLLDTKVTNLGNASTDKVTVSPEFES